MGKYSASVDNILKKIDKNMAAHDLLKQQAADLNNHIATITTQMQTHITNNAALATENKNLQEIAKRAVVTDTKYNKIAYDHAILQQAHEDLKQKHADLKQKHTTLKQAHADLGRAHDIITTKHENMQAMHQALIQKYESLDMRNLQPTIATATATATATKKSNDDLMNEITKIRDKIMSLNITQQQSQPLPPLLLQPQSQSQPSSRLTQLYQPSSQIKRYSKTQIPAFMTSIRNRSRSVPMQHRTQ